MRFLDFRLSIFFSAVVLLLSLGRGSEFLFAVFAAPFYLVLTIQAIVRLVRFPAQRRTTAIRLGIWGTTIGVVLITHAIRAHSDRSDGEAVALQIEAYKERVGSYPGTIEAASAVKNDAIGYRLTEDGRPFLFYRSTFTPFDVYIYRFAEHQWEFKPD